ncbi:putative serine/threonine-protein kinase [Acorus calamus]|uniref:Serine/threonine-protein kinase n=1 Tax=Acorus calamus TaxID=4465 RepID=A0AAV9CG18_ACOCL|nr:putative serine/threonine-protein kinase [Acorus calamus]
MMSPPKYPCSRPLSCRPGFPQCVTKDELESITNSFSEENLVYEKEDLRVYRGILCDAPVLVKCFLGGSERFRSEIDILSRVRHRNILNLVGYCCDELAKKLSWKLRHNVAIGICECIRYLHEDCPDGRISHLTICSCHVFLSYGCSPLLTNFTCAKLLTYDDPNNGDESIKLVDVCECDEVRFMAGAALLCLKDHLNQRPTMVRVFLQDWGKQLARASMMHFEEEGWRIMKA